MKLGRYASAVAAVFVAQAIVAGVLQVAWLDGLYDDPAFFRSEGDERLGPYFASRLLFVTLFVFLFVRSRRGGGWVEGLRFGVLVWLFYSVPMTVGFWAFVRTPAGLALGWILVGLAEMLVGGAVVATVYRVRPEGGG